MKRVIQFSGGLCSFFAAKRVVDRYGKDDVVLLFADVLIESDGLYRFVKAVEQYFGIPITKTADGRTPWQVFKDERYLGNSLADPCSKILKRQKLDEWCNDNCNPEETVRYCGLSWDEEHRLIELRNRLKPWVIEAPMCEPPYLTKCDMQKEALALGLPLSEAYTDGFPHDNCGGGCVKAGQAQFALLYKIRPAVYAEWERNEQDVRDHLGRDDVSILKDRRGGKRKPMTLAAFRERIETGDYDKHEWGGCGCGV